MINEKLPNKIVIIGVGLIGGSIALGLKKRYGNKITIVGFCKDPERSKLAESLRIVDKIIKDIDDILIDTQLIILATPVQTTIHILTKLAKTIKHPVLIIDVGSTKKIVCHHAQKVLPSHLTFIGTHPMAGKETSGFEAAESNLFRDKPWIICPPKKADKNRIKIVKNLIKILGSKPVIMDPVKHDQLIAWASHLPLVLTSILVSSITRQPEWRNIAKIASTGFRDTTRLASENPIMKKDLVLTNKENLLTALKHIRQEIDIFSDFLTQGDDKAVFTYFNRAKLERDNWLKLAQF